MWTLLGGLRRLILPLSGALLTLSVWEGCVRFGLIRSVFVPSPTAIGGALAANIGYVSTSTLITLRDIGAGYFPGCLLGVVLGVLLGYYRSLNLLFAPMLLLVSPIPVVTFLPLLIIWFGLNTVPILCCAFIAAFFPSLMSAISGVRDTDHTLIEVARNFGASESQILRRVILPSALPRIASGLRLSIQLCFLVTPVAEMVMGRVGLGGLIWRSSDLFKTELVFVGQLTLGMIGLLLYKLFDQIEIRLLFGWRRPDSAQ
jgi:ABC-type nitrate/sulfonate/bicarbonate transport system permease component